MLKILKILIYQTPVCQGVEKPEGPSALQPTTESFKLKKKDPSKPLIPHNIKYMNEPFDHLKATVSIWHEFIF